MIVFMALRKPSLVASREKGVKKLIDLEIRTKKREDHPHVQAFEEIMEISREHTSRHKDRG